MSWRRSLSGDEVALAKTALRYGLIMYLMGVANDLADARGTLLGDAYAPLPDIGFDYIPQVPELALVPDNLVKLLSGGKVDLPAMGFGMGDVVLTELLKARGLVPPSVPVCEM